MLTDQSNDKIKMLYLDSSGTYSELPEDSYTLVNGFNQTFGTLESLSGGSLTAKLRLQNISLPTNTSILVMYFDFSESFLKNYSLNAIFDDNLQSFLKSAVTIQVGIGFPNQEDASQKYYISSDYFTGFSSDVIGIIFSSDLKIQQDYLTNPTIVKKFALYPYIPKPTEYIPIDINFTLDNTSAGALTPKPLLSRFPKSFQEVYTDYGNAQKIYFSGLVAGYINYFQNTKINHLYSKNFVTYDNVGNFNIDSYAHNLMYYTSEHYSFTNYSGNTLDFFESIHAFDKNYDPNTTGAGDLPKTINLTVSPTDFTVLNSTVNYSYGSQDFSNWMFGVLTFTKHIIKQIELGQTTSLIGNKIDRAKNLLIAVIGNMANATKTINYPNFVSGNSLNKNQLFFANIFCRQLLCILDVLDNLVRNNSINANAIYYSKISLHLDYINNINFYPNFPAIDSLDFGNFNDNIEYFLHYIFLTDFMFYTTKKITLNTTQINAINVQYNIGLEVAKFLNERTKHWYIFDPNTTTSKSNTYLTDENYSKTASFLTLLGYVLGPNKSISTQFWHMINKHFRLKGVKTQGLPIPTVGDYTINLASGNSTTSDFLTVFSDIDIIALSLYSFIDTVYYKERSTTLSLKTLITTEK